MLFKPTIKSTIDSFAIIYGGIFKGASIFVFRMFMCGIGRHRYFNIITQNKKNKFFSNEEICIFCSQKKYRFRIKQKGYSLVVMHSKQKMKKSQDSSISTNNLGCKNDTVNILKFKNRGDL